MFKHLIFICFLLLLLTRCNNNEATLQFLHTPTEAGYDIIDAGIDIVAAQSEEAMQVHFIRKTIQPLYDNIHELWRLSASIEAYIDSVVPMVTNYRLDTLQDLYNELYNKYYIVDTNILKKHLLRQHQILHDIAVAQNLIFDYEPLPIQPSYTAQQLILFKQSFIWNNSKLLQQLHINLAQYKDTLIISVVPHKYYVKQGDVFEAKIEILTIFRDMDFVVVTDSGDTLPRNYYQSFYQSRHHKTGHYTFSGQALRYWIMEGHEAPKYKFSEKYEVVNK